MGRIAIENNRENLRGVYMKKIFMVFLITGLIVGSLMGCATSEDNDNQTNPPNQDEDTNLTKNVALYYGDAGNEKFVTEERQIIYSKYDDIYKVVLEELIKGPTNSKNNSSINKETVVYGTIKQNNELIVDVTQDFNQFAGSIAEIIGVGSVVNTLASLDDIERVKILVEGEEIIGPSGEPRGFMKAFNNNDVMEPEAKEITLYFGNQDGTSVVGEKRTIVYDANLTREEFFKRVLEELIIGPENTNLYKTIPKEVEVLSIEIEKNIVNVDFSEEMHTKHWGGATGEAMTIAAIVNTLTEFYDVYQVKMTVVGQPMSIEHVILEDPIGRNEDMIQK